MAIATHEPGMIESPEKTLAKMRRSRNLRLALVLVAIVGTLGIAFGASLLMYSDDPTVEPITEGQ